ncbi:MAG: hypothetical protein PHU71_07535, partial [Candidatus Gracilibacteria bacterium]|nr:hypothetical protein [Candidatus Gracilibacteria bacterium]
IGSFDDAALAKESVLMLIDGARHASVYRLLEKTRAARRDAPWSGEIPKIGRRRLFVAGVYLFLDI